MNSAKNSVGNSAKNSVGNSAKNSVGNSAINSVGNSAKNSVGNSAENSVGKSAINSVGNSAENSVGNSAENSVGNSSENSVILNKRKDIDDFIENLIQLDMNYDNKYNKEASSPCFTFSSLSFSPFAFPPSTCPSSTSACFLDSKNLFSLEENHRLAELALKNKNFKDAKIYYTKCIEEYGGNSAVILASRALLYFYEKNYQESLADVNRAIQVDNHCSDAWFIKGRILLEQSNFDGAIEAFKFARKLNPFDLKIQAFLRKAKKQRKTNKNNILCSKKHKEFVDIEIIVVEKEDEKEKIEEVLDENEKIIAKKNCDIKDFRKCEKENINEKDTMEYVNSEKEAAKKCFEVKNYEDSLRHYDTCLGLFKQSNISKIVDQEELSLLYSNRSQIYILLKDYKRSKADANVSLNIKWSVKAAYRFAFSVYQNLLATEKYTNDDFYSLRTAFLRLSEVINFFQEQNKVLPKNVMELRQNIEQLKKNKCA